jgi:glycosyltransferase involved in cell wall biosynthesis
LKPYFLVVIPSYNALPWLERCLESVATQAYDDFSVILIDDASTDPAHTKLCYDWCAAARGRHLIANPTNRKMPYNLWFALQVVRPNDDDVILLVDGDDWLPHSYVLQTLADYFKDPELWLTYGSYTRYPDPTFMPNPAKPYPEEAVTKRAFRGWGNNLYNHPLAFRGHLWKRVEEWELKHDDGNWFQAAYDHAIMMPMLDLAAGPPVRFKCLPEVLYTYNEGNPGSECRISAEVGNAVHAAVNARPPRVLA